MSVRVEILTAPTPDARKLIDELNAELRGPYAPEQQHGLSIDNIFVPDVRFFIAHLEDRAAGCGGIALTGDFAELKRMYARPFARGRGVATAILRRLELTSLANGIHDLRLETGDQQHAAMRFYAREGFKICPAFPPYTELAPFATATSVFMQKKLP